MPHCMCGTKVRTSHLSSVPRAARNNAPNRLAFAFSTPVPPIVPTESSERWTAAALRGEGRTRSVCRPPPHPSRT